MRKRKTKRNPMIFEEEKGAEVKRKIKGEGLKLMVRIIQKVKIRKSIQSQRAENVNHLKANTAQIVRPESEAKVETEGKEPGPEVKNETAAEVKIIQNTKIEK